MITDDEIVRIARASHLTVHIGERWCTPISIQALIRFARAVYESGMAHGRTRCAVCSSGADGAGAQPPGQARSLGAGGAAP